jgi:hypothetical protein
MFLAIYLINNHNRYQASDTTSRLALLKEKESQHPETE